MVGGDEEDNVHVVDMPGKLRERVSSASTETTAASSIANYVPRRGGLS